MAVPAVSRGAQELRPVDTCSFQETSPVAQRTTFGECGGASVAT
jgi:hypothetical protein